MADAEPEQQPRRVGLALRLDRGEQIVHRLVLPPLAAEQVFAMMLQPEDVGRPLVQPAQFQKLGDALLAQPLAVERAAADESPEPLALLGSASAAAKIGRRSWRERGVPGMNVPGVAGSLK